MCPSGIVVDDRIYVMILKKPLKMQGMYTAVNTGCSVTKLPVKSNKVPVDGKIINNIPYFALSRRRLRIS